MKPELQRGRSDRRQPDQQPPGQHALGAEESARADLIVHVVDASHPEAEAHIVAAQDVLQEIGADELPMLMVLNKADRCDPDEVQALARRVRTELDVEPVIASAATGQGRADIIEQFALRLPSTRVPITAHVPFAEHHLVALAHEHGEVDKELHGAEGTTVVATVDVHVARQLRPYLEDDPFVDAPEPWER